MATGESNEESLTKKADFQLQGLLTPRYEEDEQSANPKWGETKLQGCSHELSWPGLAWPWPMGGSACNYWITRGLPLQFISSSTPKSRMGGGRQP